MRTTPTRTRRVVVALVGAALALGGAVTLGAGTAAASDSGMLGQVNASRAAHGLKAYDWNAHLASVAAGQAQRMANKRELYHNPNLASDVGSFRWVGENVGYGPSSDVIEKAFMNSPAHRANILDDDYSQIGIASVRDSKGRLWVAQVFRDPIGGGSNGTAAKPKKRSSGSHSAPSKPKPRATSAPSPAPSARATTRSAPKPAKAPKAKPPTRKPAPAPVPTLAQRVDYAQDQAPTGSDPLADALAFAATMNAVGG